MTSCKLPPTSLSDAPNGFHDDGGGGDVTVRAGDSERFAGNYRRTASSSPEAISVSRRTPCYPAGDFYNGQCPVPIPGQPGSHMTCNEDATWFLGTGSPPPTWQGYCPEAFWMQNPYVAAAAAAAANQQQAAQLLRYGSVPDDTWLQYPYVGRWENVAYENESEDFRSIPRNRSSSDASSFAKKKRAKVKRTVTFATDRGGCDQIIDDRDPWVRNTGSEENLESPKKTAVKVGKNLRNGEVFPGTSKPTVLELKKQEASARASEGAALRKQWSPEEKPAAPQDRPSPSSPSDDRDKVKMSPRDDRDKEKTSPNDDRYNVMKSPSDDRDKVKMSPRDDRDKVKSPSDDRDKVKMIPSDDRDPVKKSPRDDRDKVKKSPSDDRDKVMRSPSDDRDKVKKIPTESPRLIEATENKPLKTSHAKHTEAAKPKSAKSQAEDYFRRGRSYSMNAYSSSSSSSSSGSDVTSSAAITPTRRRLSLGNPGVKGHIDVTANLNVQFRYSEDKDPGERIQYGRKVTCRVDGQGGMEDATHVTYVSKDRVLITDMLDEKLHLLSQSGEVLHSYVIEGVTEPWATAVTSDSTVAVTSRRARCVTLLHLDDGSVTSPFGKDVLQSPSGVACDRKSERLLVTDATANKLFIFTVNGELVRVLGEESGLKGPAYVALSPQGEIIVSDSGNHCVKVFSWMGELLLEFGKLGKEDGCLKSPQGVATDSAGNILVCDHYNNRVSVFSPLGEFVRHLVTSTHGIGHPQSLALTPDLKLYVTHGKSKATDVTVFDLEYGEFV